ncbi:DnaJ like protein subfamily C member 21 [Eufriesea mexicana]|uniref:DnaJ homolog subfamily C member 21 n=1 Tax=Eufriesea mexicana TaxID=516756 RepID=A0A310SPY4_9HYME|nr:DnaJ like protein subfamily C member 21 [Eufriesea mexicana]
MKCHYEVLEIPRNASDDNIKKAYKRLALKWHPDKNLNNPEEAKEQFQLIQQAWEVLSDPNERTWYDNHREAILKGGIGKDYKDDSIDLFQYFSPTCFKGYGDDEKGFYTVYRNVFEKLTAEDMEFTKEEDFEEVPGFGDSQSSYEEVVHNFYAYWQSYNTKRSFTWLDAYDVRDAPNRRIARLIGKENKKIRDKAKKERNEQIRNLIAFIRKRDKRVQVHIAKLIEHAKENLKKTQEQKKQQLLERQKRLKEHKISEWLKFSNIEAELKNIEANLDQEFGEDLSSEEDINDENAIYNSSQYCVACNKKFKTYKAYINHENSKRHKINIAVMKEGELISDDEFDDSTKSKDVKYYSEESKFAMNSQMTDALYIPPEVTKNNNEYLTSEDELISDQEDEEIIQLKKQKKKKQKKGVQNPIADQVTDEDTNINEDILLSKKQRKKQQQRKAMLHKIAENNQQSSNDKTEECKEEIIKETNKTELLFDNLEINRTINEKSKSKKTKSVKKKERELEKESGSKSSKGSQSIEASNLAHRCITCKVDFPSKNKLFEHLKKTGHSVYIPNSIKNKKN